MPAPDAFDLAALVTKMRPLLPEDHKEWPAAIKRELPTLKMGQRMKLELALRETPTPQPSSSADSSDAETPVPKQLLPVPVPPATWPSPTLWYEVVHFPQIMVRAEMSTTAKILGTITYGEVIAVERIETPAGGLPWAR